MRTLLQKLKVCAELLPIMLLVVMFQSNVFGQCDVIPVDDCVINGCSDTPEVIILADATCSHIYALPTLTGSGSCASGNYEIRLAEYWLRQYDNAPITTGVGTIASTQAGGSGLTVNLPSPGKYVLLYHLFDLDNNDGIPDACCMQEVEVKIANSIACNDQVQVTMDGECSATITLDMILEGETGNCPFTDHYVMTIDGFGTNQTEIVIDTPGEYNVSVYTPTGEQCWGTILVEDKINTLIGSCEDVEVFCNQTYDPGDAILSLQTSTATDSTGLGVSVNSTGVAINPLVLAVAEDEITPSVDSILFDFTTVTTNQTVREIKELAFQIKAASVNKVKACLKSPDGTIIEILDLVTGNACTSSDLNLILSDDAFRSHNTLIAASNCGLASDHAYCGDYKPLNPLAGFANQDVNGIWKLIVKNYDTNNEISVVDGFVKLVTNNGIIEYPFDGIITSTGPQEYLISLPDNNCGPYAASYVDAEVGAECVGGVLKTVLRTWTVLSESSGVESSCSQTITVKTFLLDPPPPMVPQIITPPDYDGTEYAPFYCSQFFDNTGSLITSMLTSDSLPLPSVTGSIESLFGDIELCGNFAYTYEDLKLPICGKFSYKVLRNWTIIDWCTGDIKEHTQIIKVLDNEPPVVTTVQDTIMVFTDNGFDCTGDWEVVPPITVFDCGFALDPSSYNFSIDYKLADENGDPDDETGYIDTNVFDTDGDGNPDVVRDLPLGLSWIRYRVEDDCGNVTYALTEVQVKDTSVPNPVCVEFLVLSLGSDGCAHAGAASFDKGSWDNCGIAGFEVRRLDINDDFGPYVDYCCTDLGANQLDVELKVIDLDGNENTCIIEVQLQNPFGIVWDTTADPVYNFDCEDDVPNGDTYLSLFSASQNLNTMDCPLSITYVGPTEVSAIDDCGNGTYQIIYTASNGISDDLNYTVRLNFTNTNPFDPNTDVNWNPLNEGTINGCPDGVTLDPDNSNVGRPTVVDTPCGLIAMTYEDQIFNDVENACMKVLRTWTVIDWCTYDATFPTQNIATYVQVLKINDIDLPVFNCSVSPSTISGEENSCSLNTTPLDTTGILILTIEEGSDECSEALGEMYDVEYEIDYNRDGTVDATGSGRNANGIHDYGSHSITWTITDHCGNVNSCTYNFQLRDSKPPTPYCLSEVVTVTMPVGTGTAEIWATDFDLGSTDNVTGTCNNNSLTFSLVNVLTGEQGAVLNFDCADLPDGVSADIVLQMHVADEFGNSDYCEVTLNFQDNVNDSCEDVDPGASRIAGSVYTEDDKMLAEAMVQLSNNSNYSTQMMTENDGEYFFNNPPMEHNYELKTEKQDDALNGVSTLDLVLIQKHILGLKPLDSPYKLIAADANKSDGISAVDLITIRKVILGIEDTYPNDEMPWRFVDADYNFSDPTQPFPYDETVNVDNLSGHVINKDFIAVKIGDVNSTVVIDGYANNALENRSSNTLELSIEDASIAAGEYLEIPVTANKATELLGAQFTINLNKDLVEFEGITAGAMNVTDNNFGYNLLSEGYVTASWNESKVLNVEAGEVLFTVNVSVNKAANVSDLLNISSDITRAEAYTASLESMNVQLMVNGLEETVGYELYQNVPNPFTSETTISFRVPVDGAVVLTVFDVNGRLVQKISKEFNKGINSIVLGVEELKSKGVFYYQMEANGYTATKKMIVLE